MKMVIAFVCMVLSLTACSRDFSGKNDNINNSTATSFIDKLDYPKNCLISPERNWEGDVFLIGWKVSSNFGYDPSILTEEEREKVIENGIKILMDDANKKDHEKTNRTILANYYYTKKDYKKAVYWAFKGVESGSSSCMAILAIAYSNGNEGLVQDFEEGMKWVYLGAACGDKFCKLVVDENYKGYIAGSNRWDFRKLMLSSQKKATAWMKEHSELFVSKEKMDERIL